MKIFKKNTAYSFLFLAFVILFLPSCDVDKDEPGYSYLPDMMHSQAYETYSPNPNFPDNTTMRAPVEGTLPRGMTPYPYEKGEEDLKLAGQTFKNPIEASPAVVKEGKMLFERYCIYCHGAQGKGKGNLITSGKYNVPPRDLTSEKIRNRKDGEIFHVITAGFGVMGAHGPIIQQSDRWKIIHYIRKELQDEQ